MGPNTYLEGIWKTRVSVGFNTPVLDLNVYLGRCFVFFSNFCPSFWSSSNPFRRNFPQADAGKDGLSFPCGIQICPLNIFGNYPPQMVPSWI